MCLTLLSFVVVSHLQSSSSEATLDVKSLVRFATVEDGLVATDLVGDEVERFDQSQSQLLALLVLGDCNIFDVANLAKSMDTVRIAVSDRAAGD